jgi:saccharopine dehydrogenase (NADP+, L-glutamate forming)
MDEFKELGFLSQERPDKISSWSEFTNSIVKTKVSEETHSAMKWLGLLDDTVIYGLPAFETRLDAFSHLLQEKLAYAPDERDMIFLFHKFVVYNRKTGERRRIQVSLCEFGTSEFSAMARTVGIPVAHAAFKILKMEINAKGVKAPIEAEIYKPLLKDLPFKFSRK